MIQKGNYTAAISQMRNMLSGAKNPNATAGKLPKNPITTQPVMNPMKNGGLAGEEVGPIGTPPSRPGTPAQHSTPVQPSTNAPGPVSYGQKAIQGPAKDIGEKAVIGEKQALPPALAQTPATPSTQAPLPTFTAPTQQTMPTAPTQQAMPTYTAPQQQAPTYNAPKDFEFKYDYLNYDKAKGQAEQQFNPLFEQAVEGVKAQQYQNNLDSGQSSAIRGLAHSGLAQDALTKIAIASQGQIAGLNAQKMTDVARTAQQMMDRDQDRGDRLRGQMFSEYANNRDFGYGQYRDQVGDNRYANETAYNHYRDKVSDTRYDNENAYNKYRDQVGDTRYNNETAYNQSRDALSDKRYDAETLYNHGRDDKNDAFRDKQYDRSIFESDRGYNRGVYESDRDFGFQKDRAKRSDFESDRGYNRGVYESDRGFKYQQGRDKRSDFESDRNFNYGKSQDALAESWRKKEWSQMSPAEQQRAKMELANSMKLKKASGGGGGGDYSNAVTENLPPLPDDILKQVLQAMQGNNATAISNNGRGFGQVPRTNSPDSKKARPMAY